MLARWDVVPEDRDSVLLIVGELAGNAAQHGRADMIVSLTFEGRAVHIEVADSGATAPSPHPRCTGAPDEHGRGAGIVELLADWTETLEERDHRRDRAGLRVATAPAEQPRQTLRSLEWAAGNTPASIRAGAFGDWLARAREFAVRHGGCTVGERPFSRMGERSGTREDRAADP
ncbi:ATP-binding protein [Streptomyces griseus]|uniref:ATP-binding protein n=1 Tax=Streptomyces griseus TaxID=1911 RepID=UPI0020C7C286|nr:ATP-binding protein [Streptomyces griseus]